MKKQVIFFLDAVIYWSIVVIPFFIAIAPAPMNIFSGLLIISFLLKKILAKQKLFINTAINIPFLFLFAAAALSIFNSISYSDSAKGLLRLIHYFFTFLIVAEEVKDERHVKKIVMTMIAGILLLSLDSIWQVIFGKDFIRGNDYILNIGIRRATASFPDSNVLGIYLSAVAPVVIALTLYYFKNIKKAGMLIAGLIVLTGITLTFSRPTALALYISLLIFGAVKKDKLLIFILVILTLISPFIAPRSIKEWAKQVDYNPVRFMCNDDRIAIYRNSLRMIKAHYFIGVGVNNFMKNYKTYKETPEYRGVVTSDYIYAHNNFLHMAGEIGILGLSIFLWLLYKLLKESAVIYRKIKGDFLKIISLALSVSIIAFLVNGLTESSLYYSRIVLIFWYTTGFLLGLKKFCDAN